MIANPASVLPILLDRYAREEDPAHKGLLAVLLSRVPSTHARLLEDFRSQGNGEWEVFQGFALFALVTGRGDEGDGDSSKVEFWSNLIKLADLAPKLVELERRSRFDPEGAETRKLYREVHRVREFYVGETWVSTWSSPSFDADAAKTIRGTDDPDIRRTLVEALDRSWEWDWIHDVAKNALWRSARRDLEFAGALFQHFVQPGDPARVLVGLDLLSHEELPAHHVPALAAIARRALDDPKLFARTVSVLGHQKGTAPESVLVELYSRADSRDHLKREILWAMEEHGSSAFEPMARAELGAASPEVRTQALELLAKVAGPTSVEPIVRAATSDPDPDVRWSALYLLVQANRWTPLEEDALFQMALSDPHRPLRNLATRLRAARDRTSVDVWDDSDPEEPADVLSDLK